jgi:hypothetical protein
MQSKAPHGGIFLVGQGPPYFGWWIRRFAPEFTFAILPGRLASVGTYIFGASSPNTSGTRMRARSMWLASWS